MTWEVTVSREVGQKLDCGGEAAFGRPDLPYGHGSSNHRYFLIRPLILGQERTTLYL